MIADKLKKSILQAAIQGKLTQQLSTDGDAKDLLNQIREEKNKLIADKKIKPEKSLLDLEDIEKDSGKIINKKFFDGTNATSSKNIFQCGNVLYGKLRVYLNKVVIADEDGYCTSEILPLNFGKNIFNRHAQIVLMSPMFVQYANKNSYGTKMPRLGTKAGQLALFPLPPLAEQKRIVERLEELLPLCEI